MKSLLLFSLLSLVAAGNYTACGTQTVTHNKNTLTSHEPCIPALWQRTYGPFERFSFVTDRSHLQHRCVVNVRARLTRAPLDMRDGDVKIWFKADESNFTPLPAWQPPYQNYTSLDRRAFFPDGVNKELAAEVVCAAPKAQIKAPGKVFNGLMTPVKDPECENCIRACMGYTDNIFAPWRGKLREGSVVYLTGELVTDAGPCANNSGDCHGSKIEIHPVTEIKQ
ncbi:MAG TPA: hypothetical protein VER08_00855 [Pyrinomonadaceae bacterium]|nr:hypothetical protein [Pyrinomonadaceae bacterium]